MDLGLQGRVAIVTGASRGLGRAIAATFADEGVRVVAVARDEAQLKALAAEHPGRIRPATADAGRPDDMPPLVDTALQAFGRLDIVVNNAGIAPAATVEDMPIGDWEHVLTVNVLAPVALTRAAGRVLLAQGSGKVINVASLSGLRGKPSLAAYSASKGALVRFTEAVAGEWAGRSVQVNAIAPGAFVTDAQRAVLDDERVLARRVRKIPAGRMGQPQEITALACYLASPASDFVSGSTYVIDGGEFAKL
jgi:2-deoxy-D-gluconate 3-dehydrogenase